VESLLFETFERNGFRESSLLVPVPLSKLRMLERGFNQADVIANVLGRRFGISVDSNSLSRIKHSSIHRVGMDEKARDLSVKDSFSVVRSKLIKDKKILLIDDVLTTGATVSYCAKALKKAGAVEVNVLTLARAV
jgi:ComF family protein